MSDAAVQRRTAAADRQVRDSARRQSYVRGMDETALIQLERRVDELERQTGLDVAALRGDIAAARARAASRD